MRAAVLTLAVFIVCASPAVGQADRETAVPQAASTRSTQAPAEEPARTWTFAASVYGYFLLDDDDFVLPTVSADRGRLHLEARYNYEALETGSAWLGINFSGGKKLEWSLTPMVGAVFGATDGVAPGYKGSLTWRKLDLYSEGEYVFDAEDEANNFFYNWSELTYAPTDWIRFGIVAQRTRVYQTERDLQRGLLVAFTYKRLDVSGYVFNPDDSKPIVVVAVRVEF